MKRLLLVAALAASFALAACETNQDTGTWSAPSLGGILGNQFGRAVAR